MSKDRMSKMKKEKIKSIRWVIEEFLEQEITTTLPKNNPEKVEELGNGLKENLFKNVSGWDLDESFDLVRPDEPDEWPEPRMKPLFQIDPPKKVQRIAANPEKKIKGYYDQLTFIWDKVKSGIRGQRSIRTNCIKVGNLKLTIELRLNRLSLSKAWYVQMCFIYLLEGAPYSIFRECQASDCYRWFISPHEKKKYCQEKCATRTRQKKFKKKNEDEYNKEHREYQNKKYREKVLGKPSSK
jgi:hypothetical protein